MSDWKKILRDVGYFGVGAAAVLLEAGDKAIKALVQKGESTLLENQDTVDAIKRKAREFGERLKETACSTPEEEQPVDPDSYYHTDDPVPAEENIPAEDETPEEQHPEETPNG